MRTKHVGPTIAVLFLCLAMVAIALLPSCAEPLSEEQRLADLDYLIDIFSHNHPFVSLKSRVEGYDWLAHRNEFESLVASAKTDKEFAVAMNRVIGLLNNMHTVLKGKSDLDTWVNGDVPRYEWLEPWFEVMDEIDPAKAQYWLDRAQEREFGYLEVAYSAGQYIVAGRAVGTTGKALPIGSVVTEVNSLEVDEFVYSLRGTDWQPYDPIRKRIFDRVLRLPVGQNVVTVRTPDGSYITETFKVRSSEAPRSLIRPERLSGPFTFTTRYLSGCVIGGKVGYLAISQMVGGSELESETQSMRKFLTSVASLPTLIIDIRGNPGGQDPLWYNLVSMLISKSIQVTMTAVLRDGDYVSSFYSSMVDDVGYKPLVEGDSAHALPIDTSSGGFRVPVTAQMTMEPDEDSIEYAGKVFLLVDDRVCSSAENFAAFSKATGFATLVGGVTGGDGLGYNLCYVVLPNSRMVVSFPLAMGLNPDGSANEEAHTHPDYLVEWDPADIVKWVDNRGRWHDAVLQECLRLATTP